MSLEDGTNLQSFMIFVAKDDYKIQIKISIFIVESDMSVAPYRLIPEEPPRYKKYRTRTRTKRSRRYSRDNQVNSVIPIERSYPVEEQKVRSLQGRSPKVSPRLSPQLRFMLKLQQASSVITLCLVMATLGIYAWTVYVPRLWSKEYRNLETLQRHERHLTATNESLKNQLAKQAEEPKAGLTNPKPEQAIFYLKRRLLLWLKPLNRMMLTINLL